MMFVFVELIMLRWLVLGTVVECSFRTTSVYFYRKWFVDRLMDISLVILCSVYATLYVVPFLRSLRVRLDAGPQTHLFEDRVMKIGRVDIEARGCMKAYSICLPNSRIVACGQLGCLSLVMKGETVPAQEAWEGAPIAPRRTQL
jgi:hypothetical protein